MSGPQHRAKHADKGERSWAVPRQGTGLGPLAVILPIASSAAAAIFAWRTSQGQALRVVVEEAERSAEHEQQQALASQSAFPSALEAEQKGQQAALQAEQAQQQAAQQALEAERERLQAAQQALETERTHRQAMQQALEAEQQQRQAAEQALEAERERLQAAQQALEAERARQQAAQQALEAKQERRQAALLAERKGRQAALQTERERRQAAQQALEAEQKRRKAAQQALEAEHAQRQAAERALTSRAQQQEMRALSAARAAAAAQDRTGELPLHRAALQGDVAAVQMNLALYPQAALKRNSLGCNAFHHAAMTGSVEVMRLLVEAAPETLTSTNNSGATALHILSTYCYQHQEPAMRWLLEAAPQLALVRDSKGASALHAAAASYSLSFRPGDHAAALRTLFDAAPAVARVADSSGRTALELLLGDARSAAAAREMGVINPASSLALVRSARQLQPSSSELQAGIAACLPLAAIEWASLPPAAMAAALPVVLAHSPEQAHLLVAHLPPADTARLRTLALCMARVQRRYGTALPLPILHAILAQAGTLLYT